MRLELEFEDTFGGATLDATRWLPFYLPHWSNRERAAGLLADEIQELLEMQAPGGPLEKLGVENCVDLIERRRRLVCQVKEIAGTEYIELLEQLVRLIFEKVKPRRA
jgi:hypothetical protein